MSRRKSARPLPDTRSDLDQLRADLIRDEGLRLVPYRDTTGHLTIGVGRNLDVGISEQEAMMLLTNDITTVLWALHRAFPWFSTLDPVRQRVLANMGFNLGIKGLMKFRRTLTLVESGEYEGAATAMLQSAWAGQVGARATRLADLMRGRPADRTQVVKV